MTDSFLSFLKLACRKPAILKPQKTILLLSHMRANTSLIGHILGAHPEINGYYEMHIGYYSWKSKIRQKLCYFKSHPEDPVKPFLFDKVLHSEHEVTHSFMSMPNVKIMYCIREPIKSVQSISSLYKKNDPSHEFATDIGAANYYIERCKSILKLAANSPNDYLFYTAESLVEDSGITLQKITRFLELKEPLTSSFKTQKLTGVGTTGDNSGNLNNGEIVRVKSTYPALDIESTLLNKMQSVYSEVLESI